jgi:16S rRNA (cytosine1402-N4)-methyltransferase
MHQNQNKNKKNQQHLPVMLSEVLSNLDPKPGESFLDLTAGYGGHSSAILDRTFQAQSAVLVDRDESAVDHLKRMFHARGVRIIHQDFLNASKELISEGRQFDLMLADLGVSSPHLDRASRGFSFQTDAPLDMRMDQRQEQTAAEIVNDYDVEALEEILRVFGEEPKARRIAEALVAKRPIETTTQLASIVAHAWPGHSKTHPATRTFQALRIAVNDELTLLSEALPLWMDLLAPGGRLAVITFHSLEDRIVKNFFADTAGKHYDAVATQLTKKPAIPSHQELVFNPRARSAKLRAVAKIKT